MNLIVLCRGTRGTRHIAFSPPLLAGLGACALAVLAAVFGLGFGLARLVGYVPGDERIAGLQAEVAAQTAAVAQARTAAQDQVNALAIRVGELSAHVIRLNALGGTLASRAKLDDGEFDFTSPPPMGGPDEPALGNADVPGLLAGLDQLGARLAGQQRQLALLSDLLVDRKLSEDVRPRGRPIRVGYVSSGFGRRADPFTGEMREHRGMDFAGGRGSEVVAVTSRAMRTIRATWSRSATRCSRAM